MSDKWNDKEKHRQEFYDLALLVIKKDPTMETVKARLEEEFDCKISFSGRDMILERNKVAEKLVIAGAIN